MIAWGRCLPANQIAKSVYRYVYFYGFLLGNTNIGITVFSEEPPVWLKKLRKAHPDVIASAKEPV